MCIDPNKYDLRDFLRVGKANRRKTFYAYKILSLKRNNDNFRLTSLVYDYTWKPGINIARMSKGREISKKYRYIYKINNSGIHVYLNKGDAIKYLNRGTCFVVKVLCRYEDVLAVENNYIKNQAVLTKVILTKKEYNRILNRYEK
jgi:hypothetical protein